MKNRLFLIFIFVIYSLCCLPTPLSHTLTLSPTHSSLSLSFSLLPSITYPNPSLALSFCHPLLSLSLSHIPPLPLTLKLSLRDCTLTCESKEKQPIIKSRCQNIEAYKLFHSYRNKRQYTLLKLKDKIYFTEKRKTIFRVCRQHIGTISNTSYATRDETEVPKYELNQTTSQRIARKKR